MNKTKKNGTFILLKIVFPVREYQKESLKQSMMIEKQCVFARNSLIHNTIHIKSCALALYGNIARHKVT